MHPVGIVASSFRPKLALLLLAICFQFVFISSVSATDPLLPGRIQGLIKKMESKRLGKSKLAVAISNVSSGKELVSHRADEQMIPASVLKVVSSLAALKFLGAEHRFPTEVFVDSLPSQTSVQLDTSAGLKAQSSKPQVLKDGVVVGNLYIRGYGDPSMLQEHISEIALGVRRRGVAAVKDIVIDDSLFVDPPAASGPRPYQAGLSAVSVNNNCYQLLVAPSGAGRPAYVSLTPGLGGRLTSRVTTRKGSRVSVNLNQNPLSSTFSPSMRGPRAGSFYDFPKDGLSITAKGYIGAKAKPAEYYYSVRNPPRNFAMLMKHFLEKTNVKVLGSLRQGETPAGARLLFAHESKPLSSILRDLNHYSSNFLAGQILYALGQDSVGYFRQDIGLKRIAKVLEDLGYKPDEFQVKDASGLSRGNRLSVGQIVKVLVSAYQDFSVAPDYLASLSRFGRTGTLRKRELIETLPAPTSGTQTYRERLQRAEGVWGKTGTLNGVSSVAGYLKTRTGEQLAFAIILNGGISKGKAMKLENELVRSLIEVN